MKFARFFHVKSVLSVSASKCVFFSFQGNNDVVKPKTESSRMSRKTDDVGQIDYFPNHGLNDAEDSILQAVYETQARAEERSESRTPRDCTNENFFVSNLN